MRVTSTTISIRLNHFSWEVVRVLAGLVGYSLPEPDPVLITLYAHAHMEIREKCILRVYITERKDVSVILANKEKKQAQHN